MSGKPSRKGRGGGGHGSGHHGNRQGQVDLPHRPQDGAQGGQRGGKQQSENRSGGQHQGSNQRGGHGDNYRQNVQSGQSDGNQSFSIADHTAKENAELSKREDTLLQTNASKKTFEHPQRPAFGTKGLSLTVATNYFSMNVGIDSVMSYNFKIEKVKVSEDAKINREEKMARADDKNKGGNSAEVKGPSKEVTKRIIQILIEDHLKNDNIHAASDLVSTLITSKSLKASSYSITYRAIGESQPDDEAPLFHITINNGKALNVSELVKRLTTGAPVLKLDETTELLQALNIIIGYGSRTAQDILTVGRNTYVAANTNDKIKLIPALKAMRAFVFSARAATERVLINVQVKNLPFVQELFLVQLVNEVYAKGGQAAIQKPLANILRHVSVSVDHLPPRVGKSGKVVLRCKSISGLALRTDGRHSTHPPIVPHDYAGPEQVKFWKKEVGAYVSVADHFRTIWKKTVNAQYPVVNVGSAKEPSYLPMEVCKVRPGQLAKNKLTPDQTKAMLGFAVREPARNVKSIVEVGLDLLRLERGELSEFKLSNDRQLLHVPARRLPAPQVLLRNKEAGKAAKTTNARITNAKWPVSPNQVSESFKIQSYSCLYIARTSKQFRQEQDFTKRLAFFHENLAKIGIVLPAAPKAVTVLIPDDFSKARVLIDEAIKEHQCKVRPSLLLVILGDTTGTEIYNAVKVICDVELGVVNQCVAEMQFGKLTQSRVTENKYFHNDVNIGLKINLKLGGANQLLDQKYFEKIEIGQTMFVGLDVTHPSPGSAKNAPSVASIVSSINAKLAQWPAAIRKQGPREEIIQGLAELMKGQIRLWNSKNPGGTLKNIIVYRDGVSEGQYKLVLENELPAMQQAIAALYNAQNKPKLSIIIVGKRHHTRFYPLNPDDADGSGNLKAGLVVDRGITNFCNWDFFLQAHAALKGTAKPAHYYVVYDEVFSKMGGQVAADAMEKMTHGLCYLFGRATTAVSICPPAYYADLVCERARCYMSDQFAPTSDTESTTSTEVPEGGEEVSLHPDTKEKMFYI